MLSLSNSVPAGTSQTIGPGPAYVNGSTGGFFLFCPTAMDLNDVGTNPNLRINQAVRTATNCYMRGFSEHIRIQTNSGLPWFHRRICFTSKTDGFVQAASDSPTQPFNTYIETSNGFQRLMLNQAINNMAQTQANIQGIIFRGSSGQDWNDPLIAPLDTARISVKFDKTWTLKSGNSNGTVAERKLWHPMNKSLVYDDDEQGAGMLTNKFSVDSKPGMGDYYIYDIFLPGAGGTSSDAVTIVPNSTLYWHER